jgi:hypothetical protein
MTDSSELYTGMEIDDDISSAIGTETLADRDLITPGFDNAPRARTEGLPIEIFDNRRYLKLERSATLRKGAKLSKIWNHGTEYRALDTTNLDKYWKCLVGSRPYSAAGRLVKSNAEGFNSLAAVRYSSSFNSHPLYVPQNQV